MGYMSTNIIKFAFKPEYSSKMSLEDYFTYLKSSSELFLMVTINYENN